MTLPALYEGLGRIPGLRRLLRDLLIADLRRLNDCLSGTDFAGRYWVAGGLILGWARDHTVLLHDTRDADFAFLRRDLDTLYSVLPDLERAGFRRLFRFVNNAGYETELVFARRGARFEFFCTDIDEDKFVYYMRGQQNGSFLQLKVCETSQQLVPFQFLGRTWLKVRDHEAQLRETYGNWRVPDPKWSFLEQPNIVSREPWGNRDHNWGAEPIGR